MRSYPRFYALTAAVPALLLSAALQAHDIFAPEDASKLRWQVGSQTEYLFRPSMTQVIDNYKFDISFTYFADLDSDGDLDLLLQDIYDGPNKAYGDTSIRYVENIGNSKSPVFAGISEDFQGPNEVFQLAATVDLDNDGDLDMVFWNDEDVRVDPDNDGQFDSFWREAPVYYENVSPPGAQAFITAGNFIKREAEENPFKSLTGLRNAHSYRRSGAFLDMDGDGDLDFLAQYYNIPSATTQVCEWFYSENVGTTITPDFVLHDDTASPWPKFPLCGPVQALDMDNDQDVDLFIKTTQTDTLSGEKVYLAYLQNTGSASAPQYTLLDDTANPFSGLMQSIAALPELVRLADVTDTRLVDIDADQHIDVLVTNQLPSSPVRTQSHFFKNTGSALQPEFTEQLGFDNPWYGVWAKDLAALDVDKDGDMDILLSAYGYIRYMENVGTPHVPRYEERFADQNPWQSMGGGRPNFQVLDYDHDGDSDLIVTEDIILSSNEPGNGAIEVKQIFNYIENRSTPGQPNYVIHHGANNPFAQINDWVLNATGFSTLLSYDTELEFRPIDMEHDGDWDFVLSLNEGSALYFHNIGTPTAPQYELLSGADNPWQDIRFGTGYKSGYAYWQFIDWDQDGDQDIVMSRNYAPERNYEPDKGMKYLENIGDDFSPNYVERLGSDNPWENLLFNVAQKVFFDSDNDGDLDLITTSRGEPIKYFENQTLSPDQTEEPSTEEPETEEPETEEPETEAPGTDTETADPIGWEKRAFNWVEAVAPDIAPAPGQALDMSPLSVRYYPRNGNYLGYDRETGLVYFLAPPYNTDPLKLGPLSNYFNSIIEAGF